MEISLTDFRQTAMSADGNIRLLPDGKSLVVEGDGIIAKMKRLFGGGVNTATNRDVRFAFVQAARNSGVILSPSVLRGLGLSEDSKISVSAQPLTCRAVRRLLNEVEGRRK